MDLQVKVVNLSLAVPLDVPETLPDDISWRRELFGFTREAAAVVYNRAAFAGRKLPATRAELAGMIRDEPAFFTGRIGTYDVGLSGIGNLLATQDAIRDYHYLRLIESFGRAGARLFCCTADMIAATASGDLVLTYNVIGSYARAAAAADPRIGILYLDDYNLVLSRTALILKSSAHRQAAESFVAYLLSPTGQQRIAEASALAPLDTPFLPGVSARFIPIRLGVALLAYLDEMKKAAFLKSWRAAMEPGATAP